MKFPKYKLMRSNNSQYYWVLYAVNVEPILTSSETYVSKQGCLSSIASSKTCVTDYYFSRLTASNGQFYFNQKASNGQILGKSEMYTTTQGRENGIAAVKRDAPIAEIEDLT